MKFLDTSRLEFMKIECIENKDLQIEIKTFIDSPQHLVAEGGLNYTFPWLTLTFLIKEILYKKVEKVVVSNRLFDSPWSQLCLKFFLNNGKTPWQWHMKDTLKLKILPTWINVGVEPAPRHMTDCSMLFFLSNKPSFCYSNNFCCNLFTLFCFDSPQHLLAEGGLNYTFPWLTLTSSKKFWTKNWKTL